MNYDLFKNDIDALLGAISSIPNISTIDAQLTALDDLFNDETDPGKKDALFAMKTSLAKVKEIHSRLDSLKNSPEKFLEEAKKLLTTHQALTKQGVGKPILTFDDDAIKYNIADGFISSTIPGSTISNVTKILEQMNRDASMIRWRLPNTRKMWPIFRQKQTKPTARSGRLLNRIKTRMWINWARISPMQK